MRVLTNLFVLGLGLGAGAMFFYDPDRGAQRRAAARDKTRRIKRQIDDAARITARDLQQRARGLAARMRNLHDGEHVADEVLTERIRSELGRCVSHPRSIAVVVVDGEVRLSGPILAKEVQGLVRRIKSVRGVCGVVNRLDVHMIPDVPQLQGGRTISARGWMASSPATRTALGAAGLGLWGYGWLRGGLRGFVSGTLGALCIGRALSGWTPSARDVETAVEPHYELAEHPLAP